jgi:heptosyltransferase-3
MSFRRRLNTFLSDPSLGVWPLMRAWRRARTSGRRLRAIIIFSGLGDIVAADPAFRAVKQLDEDLVVLARPNLLGIFEYNPLVSGTIRIDAYLQGLILRSILPMLRWSNMHVDRHPCNITGIPIRNRAAHGITSDNFYNDRRTLSDVYAIVAAGKILADRPLVYPAPNFPADRWLRSYYSDGAKPLVIVHTQSADPNRSWAQNLARTAISKLHANIDVNVLELGLNPVLEENARIRHLGSAVGIPEQMAIMERSAVFLGVDSGFAHIANALKIPSVYLLGKFQSFNDYTPWPVNEMDRIIRSPGTLDLIDPELVALVLAEKIPANGVVFRA